MSHLFASHLPIGLYHTEQSVYSIDMSFCEQNTKGILIAWLVEYVKTMELCGSLFQDKCLSGTTSSVFTNFYLDHTNLLIGFSNDKGPCPWCLGDLLEGQEFLIILPVPAPETLVSEVLIEYICRSIMLVLLKLCLKHILFHVHG